MALKQEAGEFVIWDVYGKGQERQAGKQEELNPLP